MVLDQLVQPFGVVPGHVLVDVDQAVAFQIAALVGGALERFVFGRDRLQIDHGEVAAAFEVADLVEHIGDAAAHAGGEVAPRLADHDDDAAGHVFAAVVAGALDHRDGAGIAHGESARRRRRGNSIPR